MKTRVGSPGKEIIIGTDLPTVLIGERINPTGRKNLAASLEAGDLNLVREEAIAQVRAGADMVDVNVGAPGVNEVEMLPRAVEMVMDAVDVPLSLDSDNPKALAAALKIYKGKPLINSVNGQKNSLREVLPLVKEYNAAVVALTMDDDGIPKETDRRMAIAHKIINRATALGIPIEDIIIDSLVLTVATDTKAGLVTLEMVRRIHQELGVNQTMGASNISFGLPERNIINNVFIAMAISAGVTCPYVNVAAVQPSVLASDLILGRDRFAQRYVKGYRQRQALKT
jgi:5-methyltetrahydrofolate--homocysteine methyltransferase